MAITVPRNDVIENAAVAAQKFRLLNRAQYSRQQNGRTIVKLFGQALWVAEWVSRPRFHEQAIDFEAIINSLDDGVNTFYAYDVRRPYPKLDPDGSILGSANPVIATLGTDNKSLTISGLPSNYTLSRGDLFHFNFTVNGIVHRALHEVSETIQASGAGITPLFEVRPHFLAGVVVGRPLVFKKPKGLFALEPNSFDPGTENILQSSGSIAAYQVYEVES